MYRDIIGGTNFPPTENYYKHYLFSLSKKYKLDFIWCYCAQPKRKIND